MNQDSNAIFLRGAHVIDPTQGMNGIADVLVRDGKIVATGNGMPMPSGAQLVDLSGHYLTPGWIDLHVHALGTLGFGDPDSIGIRQGVTSFVDAGGPGIKTLDEFEALAKDRLITDLYAGPYILPMGIVGFEYEPAEHDMRDIADIPVSEWSTWLDAHPGMVRYIKSAAYSPRGKEPIQIARKISTALGVPLYLHIGENRLWPGLDDPFEFALESVGAGDIITHVYNGCPQGQVLDKAGKLLPCVQAAADRGVLFDIGFGSYGFAWDVAEKTLAQGLRPHFISSDLQQFNVSSPTYSLANVMSICLRLGLPLYEVIECVTSNPARYLSLADRGSLRAGLPADITVFRLESGSFELVDCVAKKRTADTLFVPVMAFKDGRRIDCDLTLAQDERNWFMQVAEDHVPEAVETMTLHQLAFVGALAKALDSVDWELGEPQHVSIRKAMELQNLFHDVRRSQAIPLADALNTVYDCFLDNRFPMQMGLFLVRLDRSFALERLGHVADRRAMAAA